MENLNPMRTFPKEYEEQNILVNQVTSRIIINAEIGMKSVIRDRNSMQTNFSVSEISSCLRQSFYRRAETPADPGAAWSRFKIENRQKSALEVHNVLSRCLGWSELPLTKKFTYNKAPFSLYLNGRLDSYDWENNIVYDIKTTKAVKWQAERNYIPRGPEIIQMQTYQSMLPKSMDSKFILLYVQEEVLQLLERSAISSNVELAIQKIMHLINVPFVDKIPWIGSRLLELYDSTYVTSNGPNPEPSSYCNFCPYKQRCIKETGVSIPKTE